MAVDRQMIAVIKSFIKSDKNSLKRRTGGNRPSRKINTLYISVIPKYPLNKPSTQHAENYVVLRCDTVSSEECFLTFRSIVLPSPTRSSGSFSCLRRVLDLEDEFIRLSRDVGKYSPEDTASRPTTQKISTTL